jgi:Tfp pilus assembly protein PilV
MTHTHRSGLRRRLAAARHRSRDEHGFGLIELVIAMTVLNVGILAVFAGFSSGYTALRHSNSIANASVLADAQMERFRAVKFEGICVSTASTDTRYVAGGPEGTAVPTCVTADPALVALRDPVTGPDNRSYRLDTYLVWRCYRGTLTTSNPYSTATPGCITAGVSMASPVKLVRVTVRDHASPNPVYLTQESTFDASTGS